MEEGIAKGCEIVSAEHRAVCGLAVQSVEAWTLGVPAAIAAQLDAPENEIRKHYKPSEVESFNRNDGKPERRPKELLEQIAASKNHEDGADWRQQIAELTDPDELCRHCPDGFKPFAEKLRAAFGPR